MKAAIAASRTAISTSGNVPRTCSNSFGGDAVNPRGERLVIGGRGDFVGSGRQLPRECGHFAEGRVDARRLRYRQAVDHGDCDVGAHSQPNQIVGDEAVEHSAQKLLRLIVERSLEAEKRMRRDDAGRKDGGDERQTIRGRGDVPVGETRMPVRGTGQKAQCVFRIDEHPRSRNCCLERLNLFPLDDRQAPSCVCAEVTPIVGGVQFTSKSKSPPVLVPGGSMRKRKPGGNRCIGLGSAGRGSRAGSR